MLAPAKAFSQSEVKVLTLDQALAIAMEQNRDIQSARAYKQWVEGKYVEERAAALPQLDLSAAAARAYDDSMLSLYPKDFQEFFPAKQDTQLAQLGLSQVLFTWGQVGAAIRAAKWGLETAGDQLRQAQQAARRDVTAAFYDVLLAKELNAIARENLAQKERHRDEAQKRFDLGTATDYDVLAAQVAVENARPEVIRSANLIRTAQERLRFLLADPAPQVDAVGTLDTSSHEAPAYEDAVAVALVNRPELNDLEHRAGVARELVKIAKAGDKPRLDLRASYGHRRFDFPQFDMDTSGKAWNAGIYLAFPFFDGLATKGRVMQARSDQTRLDIQTEKLKDGIRVEVRVAMDSVEEAAEIMNALSGTVEQAERLRAMSEKGYEYGVKTRLDVEEAQLYVRQSKGNLAASKRDFLVAQTNLLWVQGVLGER
jgi:HAE1 family hydrophobic/amphiphilic exporter-1